MSKNFLIFIIALASIAGQAYADESYEVIGDSIKFDGNRVCALDKPPRYAVESYDRSAIMVSETGYVIKTDLERCQLGRPIHVFSIPPNVGVLSDVNISKEIYVALDIIDVQPPAYLATVAHIGSSKNIVSINGAYIANTNLSNLKKFAFGGSGDAGMSIISPDGNFVAPDGQIDCSEGSYPGVWSVQKNQRVVATDDVCSNFFK